MWKICDRITRRWKLDAGFCNLALTPWSLTTQSYNPWLPLESRKGIRVKTCPILPIVINSPICLGEEALSLGRISLYLTGIAIPVMLVKIGISRSAPK